jgi:hypothetical protein
VRWVQVLLGNVPLLFWLFMVNEELSAFSFATNVALALVLLASGVARPLQSWMFRMLIDWKLRAATAAAARSLVFVCLAWVVFFGRFDTVKPWIFPAVAALMLLRRCSPFGLFVIHWAVPLFTLVAGWGLAAVVVQTYELDPSPLEYSGSHAVVTGGLLFLAGAVYSLVREIIEALWKRGKAEANA